MENHIRIKDCDALVLEIQLPKAKSIIAENQENMLRHRALILKDYFCKDGNFHSTIQAHGRSCIHSKLEADQGTSAPAPPKPSHYLGRENFRLILVLFDV